jgi:hypothetical protein
MKPVLLGCLEEPANLRGRPPRRGLRSTRGSLNRAAGLRSISRWSSFAATLSAARRVLRIFPCMARPTTCTRRRTSNGSDGTSSPAWRACRTTSLRALIQSNMSRMARPSSLSSSFVAEMWLEVDARDRRVVAVGGWPHVPALGEPDVQPLADRVRSGVGLATRAESTPHLIDGGQRSTVPCLEDHVADLAALPIVRTAYPATHRQQPGRRTGHCERRAQAHQVALSELFPPVPTGRSLPSTTSRRYSGSPGPSFYPVRPAIFVCSCRIHVRYQTL